VTLKGTFDAAPCEGVVAGTVVMLRDDKIVYAGPFKGAPLADGVTVLLQADDFVRLQTHVDRRKH
jgi:hypothetical protein